MPRSEKKPDRSNPFAHVRVYSTGPDPVPASTGPDPTTFPSAHKQTARIWRDSKRRRGKTVTIIGGLQHDPETFEKLLKSFKKLCGAGGTYKEGEIEIQGDHRETISAKLVEMGYKVKQVGG